MKIQFNSPTTLSAKDGSQETFGKGLHSVDPKFADDWYLQAMVKDGSAIVMREEKEVVSDDKKEPSILDGSVAEVEKAIAELEKEQLEALFKEEAEGKNRKGVISAIEKAIEVKGSVQ